MDFTTPDHEDARQSGALRSVTHYREVDCSVSTEDNVMSHRSSEQTGHLSPEDVVAWVDRTADRDLKERIESHLADCDLCREEVVAVQRTVSTLQRRRRWLVAAVLPIAAVLVLIFFSTTGERGVPGSTVLRQGDVGAEGVVPIQVLTPPQGGAVSGGPVTFRWRSPGEDIAYHLTLTDEGGGVLWSESVPDTTIELPDSLAPLPGGTYYWFVDGLLRGGESASSGLREFLVPP